MILQSAALTQNLDPLLQAPRGLFRSPYYAKPPQAYLVYAIRCTAEDYCGLHVGKCLFYPW